MNRPITFMIANLQYRYLWDKINQFQLDDPRATITFTDKLISEQGWSRTFALKAIAEYKRFMFLCMVLPKGAFPSHTVDQVWHLHLTYTQSYWIDFCKNTLGKDIHHNPSTGGKDQDHKHEQWYLETLQQYKVWFGESAPENIWPSLEHRVAQQPQKGKIESIALVAATFGPFLILLLFFQKWNVFSLDGSTFLTYYCLIAIFALCVANWYQSHKNKRYRLFVEEQFSKDLNAYQLAYFLKGKIHAARCSIVNLVVEGKLKPYDASHYQVMQDPLEQTTEYLANPLFKKISIFAEGDIIRHLRLENEAMRVMYINRHKFNTNNHIVITSSIWTYAAYTFVMLLGMARCVQGYLNEKPISNLLTYMVLLSLALVIVVEIKNYFFKKSLIELVKIKYKEQWIDTDQQTMAQHFAISGRQMLFLLPVLAMLGKYFDDTDDALRESSRDTSSAGSCSSGGSCSGSSCSSCGGGDGGGD